VTLLCDINYYVIIDVHTWNFSERDKKWCF